MTPMRISTLAFQAALVAMVIASVPAARAQETMQPPATAPLPDITASTPGRPEPNVQQLVNEDDHVHIEELRVRGETKKIVVQSRLRRAGKASTYEVLPADNGRDMSQGPAGNRGAAGQRVWQVMQF